MPIALESSSKISVEPAQHAPGSQCNFGVVVRGCNVAEIDAWTSEQWDEIKDLVFKHQVVIFKDQYELHPRHQLELMKCYSADAPVAGMHSADPKAFQLRSGAQVLIPEVPVTQVVGCGEVPEGHYGIGGTKIHQRTSRHLYKTPLTAEEEAAGIVRPVQVHFDGAFNELEPPQVGSLFCVQPPVGEDLTLRFDNENGGELKISPGSTVYWSMTQAYELLSEQERAIVDNSRVEYAPRPFTWISTTRFTEDGAGVYTEGREVPIDELPPYDPEQHIRTYPMVWVNPLTGAKSLQIHNQTPRRLFLKDGPDAPERVVDDLAEVRAFVRQLNLRWIKPELAFAHAYDKGDLLIWHNMSLQHSATEYPTRMGSRVMHQINVPHAFGPAHGTVANAPPHLRKLGAA